MSKGKKREGGILSQFKKEVGAEFQKAKSDISADLQDAKNDLKDNISEMKSDLLTAKSAMSDAFSRIFGTPVTEDSPELLLEIRNLSVKYRTDEALIHAINDVSIGLAKGETLGVLGETGAGKTTLALSIMGLLPDQIGEVDHGEIFFEGNDLLCLPDSAIRKIRGEKISMVFQDPMASLNPLWPIGRQIAEALMLHNNEGKTTNEMEAIVDDMLRLVGIPPERKKEYPHQFSGGMKQRVVIAIALACTPKMLIADEPTTALDVTIQAQVLSMMQDLKERLGTS
ncbi:MAG: ABC transporter ATP-binding protein, partial [Clostridiales Family XIII bacterium]|nr:ABC transporter ATP-binding protein [Clostridiales Family XIII bacterium]